MKPCLLQPQPSSTLFHLNRLHWHLHEGAASSTILVLSMRPFWMVSVLWRYDCPIRLFQCLLYWIISQINPQIASSYILNKRFILIIKYSLSKCLPIYKGPNYSDKISNLSIGRN